MTTKHTPPPRFEESVNASQSSSQRASKHITHNVFDKSLAGFMVFLLSPVMVINSLMSLFSQGAIFTSVHKIDALGHPVMLRYFTSGIFKKSALLLDILSSHLSFCGVPLTHRLPPQIQADINQRYTCNPGIYSLFDLHQRTGLVDNAPDILLLKQFRLSTWEVFGLIIKSVVCTCFYGPSSQTLVDKKAFPLFGLTLNNLTMKQATAWVTTGSKSSSSKKSLLTNAYVNDTAYNMTNTPPELGFFINVNSINISLKNSSFIHTLQKADRLFADGSGMKLAAKSAGYYLKENTNGTDMLPHLCKSCIKQSKSLYFLGAKPGVAEKAAANLSKKYPGLTVKGTQHGYINPEQFQEQINIINDSGCDILLVAMGSPFQEEWLLKHRAQLTCKTALAVGGLFDFYSGDIARAPLFIREIGLEWVWRLAQEPMKKFTRYIIGNPLFLFRIYVLGLASKGVK